MAPSRSPTGTAALGAAFGMQILAYDPVSEPPGDVRCADLGDLAARSDVITLHLPLNEQTRHLVGDAFLARVKPGAVLVNCGRGGANTGYTTVLGNAALGDYARFQPGPGNSMSYDDLKVIEAKKFLVAAGGGEQRNSTIEEALADAEVIAATAASARDGAWHKVAPVPGATFGHS